MFKCRAESVCYLYETKAFGSTRRWNSVAPEQHLCQPEHASGSSKALWGQPPPAVWLSEARQPLYCCTLLSTDRVDIPPLRHYRCVRYERSQSDPPL